MLARVWGRQANRKVEACLRRWRERHRADLLVEARHIAAEMTAGNAERLTELLEKLA